jgi:hypothetical protein
MIKRPLAEQFHQTVMDGIFAGKVYPTGANM